MEFWGVKEIKVYCLGTVRCLCLRGGRWFSSNSGIWNIYPSPEVGSLKITSPVYVTGPKCNPPYPHPAPPRTRRASDCEIVYNTCSGRLPMNQNPLQGHLWSYSMKALICNPSCDVSMSLNHLTRIFIWLWECGSTEVRSRNSLRTFEEHGHRVWQEVY